MEFNDYRVNAYKKVQDMAGDNKKSSSDEDKGVVRSISPFVPKKIITTNNHNAHTESRQEFRPLAGFGKSPDSGELIDSSVQKEKPYAPVSISREIRRNSAAGTETLTDFPAFEKVNAKVGEILDGTTSFEHQQAKDAADILINGGLLKVPGTPEKKGEKESIYRRVAKFLVIIGVDEAAKVIPHLSQEQVDKIIPEIATIRKVDPQESEQILKEFNSLLEKSRQTGGVDAARDILIKAYGEKKADEILAKAGTPEDLVPFEYLQDVNPDRIKLLLQGESVPVQAFVLSQLEPKKAAGVINLMDKDDKTAVMVRLAKMEKVNPEIIKSIDKSLHQKLLTQNTENSKNMDGRNVLAQILKRMDPLSENSIIQNLADQDPDLGKDLRELLFTEEDVVLCEDRYMQEKLRRMEDKDIALLLKGKSKEFRAKILSNVSRTHGDIILQEEKIMGAVPRSDVDSITGAFYSDLRRAWERGDLRITGRDGGEIYVE